MSSTMFTSAKLAVILFVVILLSKPALAEPDPRRIEDGIWKAVVRIEAVVNTNGDTAVGTGFVVSKAIVRNGQTNRVSFLVTNKHMVGDWNAADGDVSTLYRSLRLFCYSRAEPLILSNLQELVRWKHVLLHPDPKVDVAIISVLNERVPLQGMSFDVSMLSAFSDTDPIGMGDQVFALGYPHDVRSLNNNYPVAKAGYVSTLPGEIFQTRQIVINRKGERTQTDIQGKIYLVDGLLVPGNSGGPVMTPSETKVRNRPTFQTRYAEGRVIGVMSMTLVGAGLSIVYSSDYVSDLINEFEKNVEDVKGNSLILRP